MSLAILAGCLGLRAALGASVISVTSTNDSGPGSLRDAIASAETSAPPVTIQFAIAPTNGTVQTITPASTLPAIAAGVIIDGYTQPGASSNTLTSGNNAVILIELNGSQAPGDGLVITGGLATVRGLVINRFSGSGVNCSGLGGDVIQGNFIGTDATGTNAGVGNVVGVTVGTGATNTMIGGSTPDKRNLISGNSAAGINVLETNVVIQGNFIGTDVTGTNALPSNSGSGVILFDHGVLGGTASAARNIISGNGGFGVAISGVSNVVEGNFIGTDVTGSNAVGNALGGVQVAGPSNTIGGLVTGARNIISGNEADGVDIFTDSTTLVGNFIGTDASGSRVISNALDGVLVNGNSNIIGGTNKGALNVISGNANGIRIDARDTAANSNVIQGNRIGTDITGTHILSNSLSGVLLTVALGTGAADNTLGGTNAGAGNIIAGNGSNGVTIVGDGSTNNAILGNLIFSNAVLGIDLGADGPTPNHTGFLAGPNDFQNFPVITSAPCSNGGIDIQGTVGNLTPGSGVTVQFFANPACDPSGFGQGETLLGSTNLTADISSNATFDILFAGIDVAQQVVTATATDGSGNSSEFSPCTEVLDILSPTITQCATSFVVSADANCQAAVRDFTTQVLATDNCTPSGSLIITQSPTNGTLVGMGPTNVTITVSDSSGNTTNCSVSFTVVDTTPPVIAVTSVVVTGALGSVSNVVNYATPAATDNCSTNGTITVTCIPPTGSLFKFGTNTVACTAADGAGNIASNSFSLAVLRPPGPDLTGIWLATTAFSLSRNNYVFGAFEVINRGTTAAPRSLLEIFRSTTTSTNNAVLLRRKISVRPLPAGHTNAPVVFGFRLPKGVSGTNLFLIAAMDPNHAIPEQNELNNVISIQPTNFLPHPAALAHFFQTVHQATKGR